MVSFSCEVCNDTVKKNKLDQHAQRCRGAYFTCIDCSTTFNGTDYRSHTSCISEAEKYEKALYRGNGKPVKSEAPKASSASKNESAKSVDITMKNAKTDAKKDAKNDAKKDAKNDAKKDAMKDAKKKVDKISKKDADRSDKKKKDVNTKTASNSPLADVSRLSEGSLYRIVKCISKESKLDKKKVMEKLQVKIVDGKLEIVL